MASDMKPEERAERVATEWHHSGARIAREHVSVAEIAKEIREAEQQARKEAFEEAAKILIDALASARTLETVGMDFGEIGAWGRCMIEAIRSRAKESSS